jgi:hypothetical protein
MPTLLDRAPCHPVGVPTAPDLPSAPRMLGALPGRYRGQVEDWSTPARGRRRTRKAWFYASAFCGDVTVGVAVVDAGLLATAFVYVAHGSTYTEKTLTRPRGFPRGFAPSPTATWELGAWSVRPREGGWLVTAPGVRLHIGPAGPGLTAISNAPGRPFHHTWKELGLPATVELADGRRLHGRAAVDVTLGHPPRRTQWHWASLDADGLQVNLVAHLLDGLENAVWVSADATQDARVVPVGQALFSPGPQWHVRTVDGLVDIRFDPQGARSQNLRLGVLASRFTQPYGQWSGTVLGREASGHGVVEEHRATW